MLGHSGIGTYLTNVLPRLARARPTWRWTLLGNGAALTSLDWADPDRVKVIVCEAPIYSIREQLELAAKRPRDADLFWSPHYNVPVAPAGRLMVTLHDLGHLALPQFFPGLLQRLYARTMFGTVRLRASTILCISEFTRREYLRLIGAGRADPTVVHPGIDPSWSGAKRGGSPHPRPYIVCVGVVKQHKNIGTLVRAFARIHESVPHDLIVIGRRAGMRTMDEDAERAAAPLGARVTFMGEVAFEALQRYVAYADALVSTSLHEGFGLPPLEAMAAGCPCLVSNTTALPEACGDAALYCDPTNVDDVAQALHRLLNDGELRATLRERGRQRAASFTWERCADATAAAMSRTLGVSPE